MYEPHSLTSQLDIIASYLPDQVVRHYAAGATLASLPTSTSLDAGMLFADISGFTTLAEQLTLSGPAGVEELSRILNITFSQLLDIIKVHGGDVIKFAGDALLAIWPAEREGMAGAVLRAAQCALGIQKRISNFYRLISNSPLYLRIVVSGGSLALMHIGGAYGRWEFLVTGEPLVELALAEQLARPGDVMVAEAAWRFIAGRCSGERRCFIDGDCPGVRLIEIHSALPPQARKRPSLNPAIEPALRAYLPGAVMNRLVAGQTAWLADLRRITVIFVNLPDLNHHTPVELAQTAMRSLQQLLYRYEGSVNKLSLDNKGATLVAAMGLPPLSHIDDPARAVQAALAMQQVLTDLNFRSAIGITTGRAFCGEIGSDERREYTMIGDVVNLAARLMQAAAALPAAGAGGCGILCDAATRQSFSTVPASPAPAFEELEAVIVKGKAEAIPIFRPFIDANPSPLRSSQPESGVLEPVGRRHECRILDQQLAILHDDGPGGAILIEAEAGLGKSHLVLHTRSKAEVRRITTFIGAADATEQATPYYAWRSIFSRLLDLDVLNSIDHRRAHILSLLEDEPDVLQLAPLLNNVLLLDLPDNEITGQLSGKSRADATRNLLLRMIEDSATRSPKLLILEDAHWMDSASWSLALAVVQRVQRVLLLVTMRPIAGSGAPRPGDSIPPEYHRFRQQALALHMDALSAAEGVELVCRRLGVSSLPAPIAELIRERAQGNPLYSEALAFALRDTGLIQVVGDSCVLAPGADLERLSFPETVQGAIISRIDRLTPTQQLALKVASVFGRVFPYSALQAIFPTDIAADHLSDDLDTLARLDITVPDGREPEPIYSFKHAIIQEVVYDLMLFSQRRQLHRAVAEWYEQRYGGNGRAPIEVVPDPDDDNAYQRGGQESVLAPYYSLLAYHWRQAGIVPRALTYLEQAGRHALRISALQDARAMFEQALDVLDSADDSYVANPIRWRISLNRLAGESCQHLGDMGAARRYFNTSLALARSTRNQIAEVAALSRIGRMLSEAGDYSGAQEILTTALQLSRPTTAPSWLADVLANLGVLAFRQGSLQQAEAYFQESMLLASRLDDRLAVAYVLSNLGDVAIARAAFDEARYCYEESLQTRRALGHRWGVANALWNLGRLALLEGCPRPALELLDESLAIFTDIGDQRGLVLTMLSRGSCMQSLDKPQQAWHLFAEALGIAYGMGSLTLTLESLLALLDLHIAAERYEQATELFGFAATASFSPALHDRLQNLQQRLQQRLPPAAYAAALAHGQSLSVEQMVESIQQLD